MSDQTKHDLDLENIAKKNPLVDIELHKAASKAISELRKLGIKPAGYNLMHPFSRSLRICQSSPQNSTKRMPSR